MGGTVYAVLVGVFAVVDLDECETLGHGVCDQSDR